MFHIRSLDGVIERRLLINFRVRPDALARFLPPPFAPQLVNGWGMAGICLIRLGQVRPRGLPPMCGFSSENAAHRVAVTWLENDRQRRGVYIPRRDTSSAMNLALGGRSFPGVHHRALFSVTDSRDHLTIVMRSLDLVARVEVEGHPIARLSPGSVFASLAEASDFFRGGSVGFSATDRCDCHESVRLITERWSVEPLAVEHVESSFFGDRGLFAAGTVEFDSALIMRNVPCCWRAEPPLRAAA